MRGLALLPLLLSTQAHADFMTGYLMGSMLSDSETKVTNVQGQPCMMTLTRLDSRKSTVNLTLLESMRSIPERPAFWSGTEPAHTYVAFVNSEWPLKVRETEADILKRLEECRK